MKPTPVVPPRSTPRADAENHPLVTRPSGMGEVIPGMFVSFHDDNYKAVKVDRQFTHLISISSSNTGGRAQEYSSAHDSQVRALHLTIPIRQKKSSRLLLTPHQLRTARDFLSLSLPYTSESGPSAWTSASTRLLITTPFGRAVDAVCAISAYLSYTSGEDVCDVLSGMHEIEDLSREWKVAISEDDIDFVQEIADEEA